ncbi:hypothetical protein QOZ80_6AG0518210 [Eleusine coracana subsp. coracana]|nr:hypothetical protein QOZ80_6AG0518210 [Eleusine coracana subsp. coracana]
MRHVYGLDVLHDRIRTCYNNAYFARVGGISLSEMNYLEVDFLLSIGFDLNVSPEMFGHYCIVLQYEMLCLELRTPAPPASSAGGPSLLQCGCCLSEDDGTTTKSSRSSQ